MVKITTFKKILGWIILINILPIVGILITLYNKSYTLWEGYLMGWVLNSIPILIIGLLYLIIYLMDD